MYKRKKRIDEKCKMPKVKFVFDKEKDLWNNWATVNYESPWEKSLLKKIPTLTDMCKGKTFEECKDKLEEFNKIVYESPLIEVIISAFQEAWNKINNEFFKRLERIMKSKFPLKKVTVYLTTQYRCPYNEKERWFMVSIYRSIFYIMATAGHELMHLHFHKTYWPKIEKQIGKEKTANLKEALTVLLNLEFRDLWFVKDEGKNNEEQQELRKYIVKKWKEKKDFDSLMKNCVSYLKRRI